MGVSGTVMSGELSHRISKHWVEITLGREPWGIEIEGSRTESGQNTSPVDPLDLAQAWSCEHPSWRRKREWLSVGSSMIYRRTLPFLFLHINALWHRPWHTEDAQRMFEWVHEWINSKATELNHNNNNIRHTVETVFTKRQVYIAQSFKQIPAHLILTTALPGTSC